MTGQRGTMSCVALREKKQKSMFIAEPVIKIEKNCAIIVCLTPDGTQTCSGFKEHDLITCDGKRITTCHADSAFRERTRVWEKSARSDCPSDCRICNKSSLPLFWLPFPWRSVFFFSRNRYKRRHPGYRWYLFATAR